MSPTEPHKAPTALELEPIEDENRKQRFYLLSSKSKTKHTRNQAKPTQKRTKLQPNMEGLGKKEKKRKEKRKRQAKEPEAYPVLVSDFRVLKSMFVMQSNLSFLISCMNQVLI